MPTLSATYRMSGRTDVGGNYTLSRLWGNFDGESLGLARSRHRPSRYPEYAQASWNYPDGNLSADQRHRSAMWVNYGVPKLTGLTVSVLETTASGVPYGAVGTVNVAPFVTNPGYLTPLTGTLNKSYYFTARDAFRTEACVQDRPVGDGQLRRQRGRTPIRRVRTSHRDQPVQPVAISFRRMRRLVGLRQRRRRRVGE